MKSLLVTVAGILLSLVASLYNIYWLTVLSAIIAVMAAYSQYKDALPYEFIFDASLWQKTENDFKLVIPKRQHKKENPTLTIFIYRNQTYQ